jgi:transcription initiation factor TFIID subunit 10
MDTSSFNSLTAGTGVKTDKENTGNKTQEELCDFYCALESYCPTVPECVVSYYLRKSGVSVEDPRIAKLVSLAADKFLAETIHETRQISLLRSHATRSNKRKVEAGDVLEQEDLERALAQQKICLKRKKDGI